MKHLQPICLGLALILGACADNISPTQDAKTETPIETKVTSESDVAKAMPKGSSYLDGRAINKTWPGEYPNGLSVIGANVVVKGYEKMDPGSAQTVDCPMEQGGFYHLWNTERVNGHKLEFFNVVEKQDLVLNADVETILYFDAGEETRTLKKGERILYLGYLAEGHGFVEVDGRKAQAFLEEILTATDFEFDPEADTEDYWMKMDCNGQSGFIFADDLDPKLIVMNSDGIQGYGEAGDLTSEIDNMPGREGAEYICYTRDDNKAKRIWIRLGLKGQAEAIKYEGMAEEMDLSFVSENMSNEGAYPTTTSVYNEIYQGAINGQYTLTHSGIWDYVKYVRGKDGKVFSFTIDHDENPYGTTPCFD